MEKNDSTKVIEEMVDKLIKNEMINFKMIPDFIERKLYINIAKVVVGVMTETLQSTHIKLLGHDIAFTMKPDVEHKTTEKIDLKNDKKN